MISFGIVVLNHTALWLLLWLLLTWRPLGPPGPPDLTQAAAGSWVPTAARVGKCGKCQAAWQVLVWPLDPR